MKKIFSILFALLILLSGMHLSFDSHHCGGELSGVKFSTSGEMATCGMESDEDSPIPVSSLIKPDCCKDELTTLTVDSNYSPSSFHGNDIFQKVIAIYAIPISEIIADLGISKNQHPINSPRDVFWDNSPELSAICVFRI